MSICCDLKNDDSPCCNKCCALLLNGRLQCNCGETEQFSWLWDDGNTNSNRVISMGNKEVLFHPIYSSGTAFVRGNQVLKRNRHYFFEIKVLTYLYGTDVMIGVGTSQINTDFYTGKFISMLGCDDQSWGYSYRGFIQHKELIRWYSEEYGLGSLIGVHVDMCEGTLEYYLNRRPLGVAFRGLKNYDLYPMVCSTAAQSSVRLSCSIVFEPSLQFGCLKVINRNCGGADVYNEMPGLSRIFQRDFFWLLPEKDRILQTEDRLELEDEVVIPINSLHNLSVNKWGRYVERNPSRSRILKRRDCKCVSVERKLRREERHTNFLDNIQSIRKNLDVRGRNRACLALPTLGVADHADEDDSAVSNDVFMENINDDLAE